MNSTETNAAAPAVETPAAAAAAAANGPADQPAVAVVDLDKLELSMARLQGLIGGFNDAVDRAETFLKAIPPPTIIAPAPVPGPQKLSFQEMGERLDLLHAAARKFPGEENAYLAEVLGALLHRVSLDDVKWAIQVGDVAYPISKESHVLPTTTATSITPIAGPAPVKVAVTLKDAQGNIVQAEELTEDAEAWHVKKGTINGAEFEHCAFDKTQWKVLA